MTSTQREARLREECDTTVGNAGGVGYTFLSGATEADLDGQVLTVQVPRELLTEAIDALDRAGCQFAHCTGPTLEPVDMVTCYACVTLAKLRQAAGVEVTR